MHCAAALSQSEGVAFICPEAVNRPIPRLHISAPMEHDVGWLWAQAAEEVESITAAMRILCIALAPPK